MRYKEAETYVKNFSLQMKEERHSGYIHSKPTLFVVLLHVLLSKCNKNIIFFKEILNSHTHKLYSSVEEKLSVSHVFLSAIFKSLADLLSVFLPLIL
jgi:hypothetical protein